MATRSSKPMLLASPGTKCAVVRVAVTAEHRGVAARRLPVVVGEVDLQLVQLLEVPADRALRAVELEGHLALRADDRPRALERAAHAVGEHDERGGVVLVRHLAGRDRRAGRRRSGRCAPGCGSGRCRMNVSLVPTTLAIGPTRKVARSTAWLRMSLDTP